MSSHSDAFKEILGDKGVLTPDDGLDSYQIGARGDIGKALCVLRPSSTEEVSQIVAYCFKHNLHIIPQSGNTGLVAGSVPDESGEQVLLSLDRMNNIIEIDPVNPSIHVGAGVRLSAANKALEEHGLMIPIDLGSDPCIGGMASTNTGGSRYLKYRGMREQIMGIKCVLADENGTIIDALTPLHKNNTGLDVKQLFIGSCGMFGIITEVIVRLSPILQQSATALLVPANMEVINPLLLAIEKACGSYLSAFEGMSGNAMRCAFDHCPGLPSPFGQEDIPTYAILLEISRTWKQRESEQSLDEVLENILAELWESDEELLCDALLGAGDKLWVLRHSISEGVQKSGKLYAFDISFKRSDLAKFRARVEEEIAANYTGLRLCDFGHIGDGALHCSLVLDKDDPRNKDASFEAALRETINDIVVKEFGGSYSAEHALGRKVQAAYDRYTSEEIKSLTRAIKTAIAPAGIGVVEV